MTTVDQHLAIIQLFDDEQLRGRVSSLSGMSKDLWEEWFVIYAEKKDNLEAAQHAYARVMQWWSQPADVRGLVEGRRPQP